MKDLIHLALIIPLVGFLISILIPRKSEKLLSWTAFGTFGLHLLVLTVALIVWTINGFPTINLKDFVLFKTAGYEFFVDFYFDRVTATFSMLGAFLTFLVAIYSRVYLHRESGYKRFFNTIHLFFIGFTAIIFSGNLETLFTGWEILGISSFLLIAFYRDRYLPVRNAYKVYSIYRLGDIGLILAMWMSHHLWHENITFLKMLNADIVIEHLKEHSLVGVFVSIMILVAAVVKSAQFPFSSWLPRAMEGPTPSSAIFYGSLSVHLGAFLLLRTFPFWEHQFSVRILIGLVGLLSALLATGIARVQSNVKTQIAYSSIVQIGLIFIEIAAGFEALALIHIAGNAFLRTYQLLVSPSVVSYLIKEQFYNFVPRLKTIEDSFPRKIMYSIYILCLKEFNLDAITHSLYHEPIKRIGSQFRFLNARNLLIFLVPALLLGAVLLGFETEIPSNIHAFLPAIFSVIGLLLVLRAYVERKSALLSWNLVIANHIWIALAISFNEHFTLDHTFLYLSGIVFAGIVGMIALRQLKKKEDHVDLDGHQGHAYEHKRLALIFLLACLGITGFPITPSFIGEDLIFSHIHENQIGLAAAIALSLIIDGLAIIRIYSKIFMGAHIKTYHEVAYKSS